MWWELLYILDLQFDDCTLAITVIGKVVERLVVIDLQIGINHMRIYES